LRRAYRKYRLASAGFFTLFADCEGENAKSVPLLGDLNLDRVRQSCTVPILPVFVASEDTDVRAGDVALVSRALAATQRGRCTAGGRYRGLASMLALPPESPWVV
jgi:hypothetical protein